MLVKRYWFGRRRSPLGHCKAYCGWFLFGIIPLYIRELEH